MTLHNILIALCVSFLLIAFTACDAGSSSGIPTIEDTSVGNPDPGTEILPHTPPGVTPPVEATPDEGNEGGSGDNQQPVPEPSTLVLVGSGIALITLCRKKKKKQENL